MLGMLMQQLHLLFIIGGQRRVGDAKQLDSPLRKIIQFLLQVINGLCMVSCRVEPVFSQARGCACFFKGPFTHQECI
jgi:hypothetical protein